MTTNQIRLAVVATIVLGGTASARLSRPTLVIDSPGPTCCVAVSYDGKLVAGGCRSGKIFLWDAATGKRLLELDEGKYEVDRLCFTAGGKTLVTASTNQLRPRMDRGPSGRLTWWDLKTRKCLTRLDFKNSAGPLRLSPDGKTLAAGSGDFSDKSIRLYEAATGKFLRSIPNREDRRSFAFSPDGKSLAVGSDKPGGGGRVTVWDLSSGNPGMVFEANCGMNSLAFSPDGKTIACAGYNLFIHRTKDGKEVARNELMGIPSISHIAYAKGGKWLLGEDRGGTVFVFDGVTGAKRPEKLFSLQRGGRFALSRDGKVMATVGEDEVKLWRIDLWE